VAQRNTLVLPLLLVLLLCGTAAIAWHFLGGRTGPLASPSVGAPGATALPPVKPALPQELARSAPPVAPAAAPSAARTEERREAAETELADAIWVEGRVVLPPDVPLGEVVRVVADGKEFDHRELHEDEVGGDGTFRVAFAQKTRSGRLLVDAPHLYLEPPRALRMNRLPEEPIVLEPRLGGRITGFVRPPELTPEELQRLRESKVTFQGWSRAGNDFRSVSRTSPLGPDLAFELRGVPLLEQGFLSFDPGFLVEVNLQNVAVEPGATRQLDLELTRGARVSGTLLDEEGAAIEGVQLRAAFKVHRAMYFGDSQRTAKLQPDGSFTIEGIPAGAVELLAERQGYADMRVDLGQLVDGDVKGPIAIVMRRGSLLSGSVKWPDGRPVSGARIVVSGGKDVDGQSRIDESVAESDAEGHFEVAGLTQGPYRLEASARPDWNTHAEETGLDPAELRAAKRTARRQPPWRAVAEALEPGAELALVLTSGLGIEGDVLDDTGQRLERFSVKAEPHDPNEPWASDHNGVSRVFRDTGGAFRIEGLQPGTWSLRASGVGYDESEAVVVTLPEDAPRRLTLTVARAATLGGIVLRPDGLPAAQATVEVDSEPDGWFVPSRQRASSSDGEGRFTIERVPVGKVELRASLGGFAPSATMELDLSAGETRAGLRLALRVGGSITGELVSKSGSSTAYRAIQVSLRGGGYWDQTATDATGHFELRHLAPGTYEIQAPPDANEGEQLLDENGEMDWTLHQAASARATAEVVDGGSVHVVVGAPPDDPIHVRGVVRRAGKAVEGAVVTAWGSENHSNTAARSDASGRYELALEGPGGYSISVHAKEGNAQVSRHEQVSADTTIDFDLGSGRIAGVVVGPDGPLAEIRVSVRQQVERTTAHASAESDADGRFSFEGLGAGTYTVEAGNVYWGPRVGGVWAPASASGLELAEGASIEGVVLRLERGATLAGRVTGPDGAPVSGATVWCRAVEGGEGATWPVETDGAGRFRRSSLKPGSYTARAEHEGLVSADSAPIPLASGGEGEVDLALRAGSELVVFVEGADGTLTQAFITLEDALGREEPRWRRGVDPNAGYTPEAGFRFGPLPPGEYTVRAQNNDGYKAEAKARVRGEPEVQVRLRLSKPAGEK
jgi:protocatechuate 3,4-dioxygenase beta subunit